MTTQLTGVVQQFIWTLGDCVSQPTFVRNLLEPVNLWSWTSTCNCEVRPHFWRRSRLSCLLLAGRGHVSSCRAAGRLRFTAGLRSGDDGGWDSICPPAVLRAGVAWWTVVLPHAHGDLLHNFISESHDIMELRKLNMAFYDSDLNFKNDFENHEWILLLLDPKLLPVSLSVKLQVFGAVLYCWLGLSIKNNL